MLKVSAEDSRDEQGREKFIPYDLKDHLSSHGDGDLNVELYLNGTSFYPFHKVILSSEYSS